MKVKIIRNLPNDIGAYDISRFIGRTFNAEPIKGEANNISVDFGWLGTLTVYEEEYEIVD